MSQGELSGPDLDGVVADRPQDRVDLEELERVNGELPGDPIPGLDA